MVGQSVVVVQGSVLVRLGSVFVGFAFQFETGAYDAGLKIAGKKFFDEP
jgi:hypothetical protein